MSCTYLGCFEASNQFVVVHIWSCLPSTFISRSSRYAACHTSYYILYIPTQYYTDMHATYCLVHTSMVLCTHRHICTYCTYLHSTIIIHAYILMMPATYLVCTVYTQTYISSLKNEVIVQISIAFVLMGNWLARG